MRDNLQVSCVCNHAVWGLCGLVLGASAARLGSPCAARGCPDDGLPISHSLSLSIYSMAALIPSAMSASGAALASAEAAAASGRRAAAGHPSWVLYAPPLMDRLWFEPAAPAGWS